MLGSGFVHREDAEGLQPTGPGQSLAHDAGALIGGLVAVAPQAGDVQQHILHAVVGHDEAETLGNVEPLHHTGDLDKLDRLARKLLEKCDTFR